MHQHPGTPAPAVEMHGCSPTTGSSLHRTARDRLGRAVEPQTFLLHSQPKDFWSSPASHCQRWAWADSYTTITLTNAGRLTGLTQVNRRPSGSSVEPLFPVYSVPTFTPEPANHHHCDHHHQGLGLCAPSNKARTHASYTTGGSSRTVCGEIMCVPLISVLWMLRC